MAMPYFARTMMKTIEKIAFDERGPLPLRLRRGGSTDLEMASLSTPLYQINDIAYMSPGTTNAHLVTTSEGDVVIAGTAKCPR